MTKIGILSISRDVTQGNQADSSRLWLAQHCSKLGWDIHLQMIIPAENAEIEAAIHFARQRNCNLIILCGGRSFADNCVVCRVVAKLTERESVLHADVLAHMKEYYCARIKQGHVDYTDIDMARRMESTIPLGVELFYRDSVGLPGFIIPFESTMLLSLPDQDDEIRILVTDIMGPRITGLLEKKTTVCFREVLTSFREPAILSMLVTQLRIHFPDIIAEILSGRQKDKDLLSVKLIMTDGPSEEAGTKLDKAVSYIYRGLDGMRTT